MSYVIILGYLAFIPLAWWAGNLFVLLFLRLSGAPKRPPSAIGATAAPSTPNPTTATSPSAAVSLTAGRVIGLLERILIVGGIVFDSWEVIAAVVALKTVARYKELDEQITAEYFLIGSLASILWSVVLAKTLLFYDSAVGFDLLAPTTEACSSVSRCPG